jgi:hypothetical protein
VAKDLVGEEETTLGKVLGRMPNVLPCPKVKEYMANNDEKGLFEQSNRSSNHFLKWF